MPTRWVVGLGVVVGLVAGQPGSAAAEEPSLEGTVRRASAKATDVAVQVADVRVEGALDAKVVESRLEKGLAPVRRCYKKAATAQPILSGSAELRLLVTEKGRVSAATLERSTLDHDDLERCVQRHAMDVRFPRPDPAGHATIRYRVEFGGGVAAARLVKVIGMLGTGGGGTVADVLSGGGLDSVGLDEVLARTKGVGVGQTGASGIKTRPPADARRGTGPGSKVALGTIGASGSLDTKVIRGVLKGQLGAFRGCHERELASHPGLSGDIELNLVIAPAGTVTKSGTRGSSLSSPAIEKCVVAQGRRLKFQKASGQTKARVSLTFTPAKAAAR